MARLIDASGVTVFEGTIEGAAFALGTTIAGDPPRISTDVDGNLLGTTESFSPAWALKTQAATPGLLIVAPNATFAVFDNALGRGLAVNPLTNLLVLRGYTSAPNDADLNAGDLALWFDQTNGAPKLMVRAKQADGTVVSGSLALAP